MTMQSLQYDTTTDQPVLVRTTSETGSDERVEVWGALIGVSLLAWAVLLFGGAAFLGLLG